MPDHIDALRGDRKGGEPVEPWFTRLSIEFLEENLRHDQDGYEVGAGASTLWLASRLRHLTSIETDETWYRRVQDALDHEGISNVDLLHGVVDADDVDWVFVDGRSRVNVVRLLQARVKPGGYLLLDNSDRHWYRGAYELLSGWRPTTFGNGSWDTTIWRKPE